MPRKRAQRVVVTVFKKAFLGQKVDVERDDVFRLISGIVMKSRFTANHTYFSAEIYGTQLAFRDLR